jgi:hypothetical protein
MSTWVPKKVQWIHCSKPNHTRQSFRYTKYRQSDLALVFLVSVHLIHKEQALSGINLWMLIRLNGPISVLDSWYVRSTLLLTVLLPEFLILHGFAKDYMDH